jgi:DNA-binding NarL/FixJ family response regulator
MKKQGIPLMRREMTLKVVLVDAHALLRAGLRAVCEAAADITVVGETDRLEAMGSLVEQVVPDVVVLALRPPVQPAIDAIVALHTAQPHAPVLVISTCDDAAAAAAVLRAGARGCLTAGSPPDELVHAICMVGAGCVVFAQPIASQIAPLFDGADQGRGRVVLGRLSQREQEMLHLVARGYDNRRIARELFVAEKTVRNHVSNIMSKLDVPSRAAAVAVAWGAGDGR